MDKPPERLLPSTYHGPMTASKHKISSIIIDDEADARDRLSDLLLKCEAVQLLQSHGKPHEALPAIAELEPDLVFVDVEMPLMSGFELVKAVQKSGHHPHFVFVTAYNQYAIKAIKAEAFDFLLKPVDIDELRETLQRFTNRQKTANHASNNSAPNPHQDTPNNQLSTPIQRIKFSNRNGYVLIDPVDILYCEADGAYTDVYLKDGRELSDSNYLSAVENRLPQGHFVRISRSLLVNLAHILRVDRKKREIVILQGAEEKNLQASKRYFAEIDQRFS